MSWDEAKFWISQAVSYGITDWQMPTMQQLKALFDPSSVAGTGHFTRGQYWPAKLSSIFEAIGGGSWVWSQDDYGSEAGSFNFNQGVATRYEKYTSRFSTRAFAVSR